MKYCGEEQIVKVVEKRKRPIEYMRCDDCRRKILPDRYSSLENAYVKVHTWHGDWGNDSVESHETKELCVDCATKFVSEYVRNISGTQELELELCHLFTSETYSGEIGVWDENYRLVENDRLADQPTEKGGSGK